MRPDDAFAFAFTDFEAKNQDKNVNAKI